MQFDNAEHNDNQLAAFLGRNEFHRNSVQLADSFKWLNKSGGGTLLWGLDGQSSRNYGEGYLTAWTPNAIVYGDYHARTNGGPLVNLSATAAAEYFSIADGPAWQEAGSEEFFLWFWCLMGTIQAADMTIAAKYDDVAGNLRSWWLGYDVSATSFSFICNSTGLVGGDVTVASTHTVVNNNAYFVCGYFNPSTSMQISVAEASETTVTLTTITSGVPASLFDGAPGAALTIGASGVPDRWWDGGIGTGIARANVPSGSIRDHMTRLFASGRYFYQG